MKTIITDKNASEKDMSKKDIIETILFIISQILDYSSRLEQITPSIFDEKKKEKKMSVEDLSTEESLSDTNNNLTIEDNKPKEKYSLADYIYYWVEKLDFDEDLLFLTMMNFDKILESKMIILNEQNVENVLFTCMIITQKYYEDEKIFDKDYCRLKKIDSNELLEMQIKLLEMLNYSLFIDENDFKQYKKGMKKIWKKNMLYLCYS